LVEAVQLFRDEWPDARAAWAIADPRLYAITPEQPVDRVIETTATAFGALVRAILHQQVSIYAGRAITTRLLASCGGELEPAAVARLTEDDLRAIGLSRQKVIYVSSLATATAAGLLDRIEELPDADVIARLTALPGIGVWTAKMFCIFHLLRPDVFSGEDFGLREGIKILDGLPEQPRPRDAELRAEVWQPYRSVAAVNLWDLVRRSREAQRASRPAPRPRAARPNATAARSDSPALDAE
jgi:DNA-3-methyladenine glycosylase II